MASTPPSRARGRSNCPSVDALADVAAVVKLAVDDVYVAVEDEGPVVDFACALGNLRGERRRNGHRSSKRLNTLRQPRHRRHN